MYFDKCSKIRYIFCIKCSKCRGCMNRYTVTHVSECLNMFCTLRHRRFVCLANNTKGPYQCVCACEWTCELRDLSYGGISPVSRHHYGQREKGKKRKSVKGGEKVRVWVRDR